MVKQADQPIRGFSLYARGISFAVILCAIILPPAVYIWEAQRFDTASIEKLIQHKMDAHVAWLAKGMAAGIAMESPGEGIGFAEAFFAEPEIVGLKISSDARGDLISLGIRAPDDAPFIRRTTHVIAVGDQKIGLVEVLYDAKIAAEKLRLNTDSAIAPLIASILLGIGLLLSVAFYNYRREKKLINEATRNRIENVEAQLHDVARNVPGVLFQLLQKPDGTLNFPYVSSACERYFGLPDSRIRADATSLIQCFPKKDQATLVDAITRASERQRSWFWEGMVTSSDGQQIWLRAMATPHAQDGVGTIHNGVFIDITDVRQARHHLQSAFDNLDKQVATRTDLLQREIDERKAVEHALRQSETRFRDFTETATDWVWETDANGIITYVRVNTAVRLIFDPANLVGKRLFDAPVTADAQLTDIDNIDRYHENVAARRAFRDLEFLAYDENGDLRRLRVNGQPFVDENEKFVGFRGTGRDVTNEVKARQRLLELSAAINAFPEPMMILDSEDRFLFINDAFRNVNKGAEDTLVIGGDFETHLRNTISKGLVPDAIGRETEWMEMRLALHRDPGTPFEVRFSDGSYRMINEHRLPSGGMCLVTADVTPLRVSQARMELARDEAESASRAKSEFLASMSHELRTPLHAVLGFAQLLEADHTNITNPRHRRAIGHILTSGNHLLRLISDVLDLARIEAGHLDIQMEQIDAVALMNETIESIEPLANDKGVILNLTLNDTTQPVLLVADYGRLQQAILNLLSNAIKYGGDAGVVELRLAEMSNHTVRISVRDEGPGIQDEKKKQLFSAFARLGMEMSDIEGTGIGLTISKALIEAMDGAIGFKSEVGNGSEFWIELPLATSEAVDSLDVTLAVG